MDPSNSRPADISIASRPALAKPEPEQDGGAYDMSRPRSASNPHVLANIPLADVPLEDEVLLDGLENVREKMQILKLEDDIVQFLKSKDVALTFPPLSSYHRLIVHRLAQRCNLDRESIEIETTTVNEGSLMTRSICIAKSSESIIPTTLLIHLSEARQRQQQPHQSLAPKIMMVKRRDPPSSSSSSSSETRAESQKQENHRNNPKNHHTPRSSFASEDRERAYAQARARIFGTLEDEHEMKEEDEKEEQEEEEEEEEEGKSRIEWSATGERKKVTLTGAASNVSMDVKWRQALGPDGSRGFAADRGKAAADAATAAATADALATAAAIAKHKQESVQTTEENKFKKKKRGKKKGKSRDQEDQDPGLRADHDPSSKLQVQGNPKSAHNKATTALGPNWSEKKATWRNREEELNDPDFTRNYDMYRPTFAPFRVIQNSNPMYYQQPPPPPTTSFHHSQEQQQQQQQQQQQSVAESSAEHMNTGGYGIRPPYFGGVGYPHSHSNAPAPPLPPSSSQQHQQLAGADLSQYLSREQYRDQQQYPTTDGMVNDRNRHQTTSMMPQQLNRRSTPSATTHNSATMGQQRTARERLPNSSYNQDFPPLG